jgi:hypothetical protein
MNNFERKSGCFGCFSGSSYTLRLGATRIDVKEDGSLIVTSRRSVVHPEYIASTPQDDFASTPKNDVALIQLPQAVKFTRECFDGRNLNFIAKGNCCLHYIFRHHFNFAIIRCYKIKKFINVVNFFIF